jgi:hypothetical protein
MQPARDEPDALKRVVFDEKINGQLAEIGYSVGGGKD